MTKAIVVGDGPAGLSAALLLAKRGVETVVFGGDKTAMHYAELHNYLGIPVMGGSRFQEVAREQVVAQGADLRDEEVAEASATADAVTVRTAEGTEVTGDYLVLAAGKPGQKLAQQLGIEGGPDGVAVDDECRTGVDRVYAAGRLTRPNRSQAIISAGAGARAALDILAREAGEDVTDWDSPPKEG